MRKCALALVAVAALALGATPALGAEPWWHVGSGARPTVLPQATETGGKLVPGEGEVVVTAENVGDIATGGEDAKGQVTPVKILDTLPAGLRAVGIVGTQPKPDGAAGETIPLDCSLGALSCESSTPLVPYDQVEVRIAVEVLASSESSESNTVAVSGGAAPSVQVTHTLTIGAGATPFGVEAYELNVEGEGGTPATQAGSHPYQVTGTIALNQGADSAPLSATPQAGPAAAAKDLVARLPPGLIADPSTVPRCLSWEFLESDGSGKAPECPGQSAVGVASVTAQGSGAAGVSTVATPIFNIEPEAGEPARFGFLDPIGDIPVYLNTGVRSGPGEDWGVDLTAPDLSQNSGLMSARVTFWGVPDRTTHDSSRGWGCMQTTRGESQSAYEPCVKRVEEVHPPAFVRMPTSCTGPLQSGVEADSWTAPGEFQTFAPSTMLQALSGCEQIAFTPTTTTEPTTHSAASPSGLSFDLNFNTEGLTTGGLLAQSDLENTVVTLPEGMTIDPSAGVGLGACTPAQYAEATLSSAEGVGCPVDSKLGTVEIETPLLFTAVYGSLYLAQPYDNPFPEAGHPGGSLVALYVVARSRAERGILIKLAGKVTPNLATGRLTVSFENNPQLPFERFNFHFREGQQAPLITPATCGTYTTQAQLTPFSNPANVLSDSSSFQITSGSEGAPCPTGSLPPFGPRITAQTLNSRAGVFSPFSVDLTRTDAEQEIASYSTVLPLGLTADLSGIPFCPEAAIEAARHKTGIQEEQEPSCPAASAIGHTLVGTGVGSVLDYVPGTLYLAGPFHGDPFSVVSVISAVIGPFDIGTVVIRFGLRIDPYTAQVSIDPTGSEPIPTIIDGIVTHVRDIRVSTDRTGFTLNPTTCKPLPVSSTLTSDYGQSATVSTNFQATDCDELAFKPDFSASTQGKTSRNGGASLTVKLKMPGQLGTQTLGAETNIKQVKVDLPRQLPSRLTTLQQACTEKQFAINPAGCPKASFVGHAKAITPILPVPLTGPAIFVSHGGEAFPSLILVLQGYGVTIDLVGSTFISPKGITSSTFNAIPDEPVGSFELTLPEGRYSALAANANLCTQHLAMPTAFVGQDGTTLHTSTKIVPTGCVLTRAQKLARALKTCRSKHKGARGHSARATCERRARREYRPAKKAKTKRTSG